MITIFTETFSRNRKKIIVAFSFILLTVVVVLIPKSRNWLVSSTKINYLQSIFQLGAVTGFAFAVAGPKLRHALGSGTDKTRINIERKIAPSSNQTPEFESLKITAKDYAHQYIEENNSTPGSLFLFYTVIALLSVSMLIWSSLIDPRCSVINGIALLMVTLALEIPILDLVETYVKAREVEKLLNSALERFH